MQPFIDDEAVEDSENESESESEQEKEHEKEVVESTTENKGKTTRKRKNVRRTGYEDHTTSELRALLKEKLPSLQIEGFSRASKNLLMELCVFADCKEKRKLKKKEKVAEQSEGQRGKKRMKLE